MYMYIKRGCHMRKIFETCPTSEISTSEVAFIYTYITVLKISFFKITKIVIIQIFKILSTVTHCFIVYIYFKDCLGAKVCMFITSKICHTYAHTYKVKYAHTW